MKIVSRLKKETEAEKMNLNRRTKINLLFEMACKRVVGWGNIESSYSWFHLLRGRRGDRESRGKEYNRPSEPGVTARSLFNKKAMRSLLDFHFVEGKSLKDSLSKPRYHIWGSRFCPIHRCDLHSLSFSSQNKAVNDLGAIVRGGSRKYHPSLKAGFG